MFWIFLIEIYEEFEMNVRLFLNFNFSKKNLEAPMLFTEAQVRGGAPPPPKWNGYLA